MEVLRVLKELGCPMEEKDNDGLTVVHIAVGEERAGVLMALVEWGYLTDVLDEEAAGGYIVCWERGASWIFQSCGHRCVCRGCLMKLPEHVLGPRPWIHSAKCLLCRTTTRMVPSSCWERGADLV